MYRAYHVSGAGGNCMIQKDGVPLVNGAPTNGLMVNDFSFNCCGVREIHHHHSSHLSVKTHDEKAHFLSLIRGRYNSPGKLIYIMSRGWDSDVHRLFEELGCVTQMGEEFENYVHPGEPRLKIFIADIKKLNHTNCKYLNYYGHPRTEAMIKAEEDQATKAAARSKKDQELPF